MDVRAEYGVTLSRPSYAIASADLDRNGRDAPRRTLGLSGGPDSVEVFMSRGRYAFAPPMDYPAGN